MAKIIRKQARIFGGGLSSGSHQVEQFGSKVQSGTPNYTVDPDVIQSLSAWVDGWFPAIDSGTKAPYIQDMNGFCLVVAYQIAYILQQGVPEWNAGTTYFQDSVVQANGGQWYSSLIDNNVGNAPPAGTTDSNWAWVNPPQLVPDGSTPANSILKVSSASAVGPAGSLEMVAGMLSDDGTDVIITGTPGVSGLKFPDNTVQKTAAINNAVTVQSVVTGSRALGTVFQNTGVKPLFVCATVSSTTASLIQVFTDAAASPSTVVAQGGMTSGPPSGVGVQAYFPMFFIVLPNNYYKITVSGSSSMLSWTEWS